MWCMGVLSLTGGPCGMSTNPGGPGIPYNTDNVIIEVPENK